MPVFRSSQQHNDQDSIPGLATLTKWRSASYLSLPICPDQNIKYSMSRAQATRLALSDWYNTIIQLHELYIIQQLGAFLEQMTKQASNSFDRQLKVTLGALQ